MAIIPFVLPFKSVGKIWSIPSSPVPSLSSPFQSERSKFSSISGRVSPRYGWATAEPLTPLIWLMACVAIPYESGASPSSNGKKPSIADCLPEDAIYNPISEAPRVITIGTANTLEETLGPNTPVPKPPVVVSGLP